MKFEGFNAPAIVLAVLAVIAGALALLLLRSAAGITVAVILVLIGAMTPWSLLMAVFPMLANSPASFDHVAWSCLVNASTESCLAIHVWYRTLPQ